MPMSAAAQVRSLASLLDVNLRVYRRPTGLREAVAAAIDTNPALASHGMSAGALEIAWQAVASEPGQSLMKDNISDTMSLARLYANLNERRGISPQTCTAVLDAYPVSPDGQAGYEHIAALMLLRPNPAEVGAWAHTAPPTLDDAMFLIALRPAPLWNSK